MTEDKIQAETTKELVSEQQKTPFDELPIKPPEHIIKSYELFSKLESEENLSYQKRGIRANQIFKLAHWICRAYNLPITRDNLLQILGPFEYDVKRELGDDLIPKPE